MTTTPTQPDDAAAAASGSSAPPAAKGSNDPLAAFDTIVAGVAERDIESGARTAQEADARKAFEAAFAGACDSDVRPAMEAVITRLRSGGGGGTIEHHAGGEPRFQRPSLIGWMSLEGEIEEHPRPDREPYLQLEADVDALNIRVSEGDMWRGGGGSRSGLVGAWTLSDLTRDRVIAEMLDIARRSAQ